MGAYGFMDFLGEMMGRRQQQNAMAQPEMTPEQAYEEYLKEEERKRRAIAMQQMQMQAPQYGQPQAFDHVAERQRQQRMMAGY